MTISHHPFINSASNRPTLSVVVPIYNEREVLPLCLQQLQAVIKQLEITAEFLFVDDGSRDGSRERPARKGYIPARTRAHT